MIPLEFAGCTESARCLCAGCVAARAVRPTPAIVPAFSIWTVAGAFVANVSAPTADEAVVKAGRLFGFDPATLRVA
jgi:hypothetical protein